MSGVPPELVHRLDAAEGWLLLGRPDEAALELDGLGEAIPDAPRYLELGWRVAAAVGDWGTALARASVWVTVSGGAEVAPWIQRAYALRRAPRGGLREAFEALLPALDRFPLEPIVPYNLACYQAQSGHLDSAWELLREAVRRGGGGTVVEMARDDSDLLPIADRIEAEWPRDRAPGGDPGP